MSGSDCSVIHQWQEKQGGKWSLLELCAELSSGVWGWRWGSLTLVVVIRGGMTDSCFDYFLCSNSLWTNTSSLRTRGGQHTQSPQSWVSGLAVVSPCCRLKKEHSSVAAVAQPLWTLTGLSCHQHPQAQACAVHLGGGLGQASGALVFPNPSLPGLCFHVAE